MDLPPTVAIRENDLQVGQRVVYPNQGVCRITGIEVKDIGGIRAEFLTMKREEDGATVMVPRAKLSSIGLRHLAQPAEIQAILKFLEAESGDPELDWKVRHRTHSEKMTDGSLTGTAEVLKALHSLAERRPLPQKERELYDSARHLVVNEVAVALAVPRATAEDIVDFCLTPPAGSPRAAHKAKLKAEREAAEESALLEDLDDLADVAGMPEGVELLEGAADEAEKPMPEAPAPDTAKVAAKAKAPPSKKASKDSGKEAGKESGKEAKKPAAPKAAPKPAPKAAAKPTKPSKPKAAVAAKSAPKPKAKSTPQKPAAKRKPK